MQYIYTLTKENTLDFFEVYHGGKIEDNQTLVKPADGLFNPTFNKNTEQWEDGEEIEIEVEPPKPKTEEELLQEQIEETKRKTVTEFELRKLLAEQQRNNMKMMMMMLKK